MKKTDLIMELLHTIKGIKYVAISEKVVFSLGGNRVGEISLKKRDSDYKYEGIKITISSKIAGVINEGVLWFSDCFKDPYVNYKGSKYLKHIKTTMHFGDVDIEHWSDGGPSPDDFKSFRDTIKAYIDLWK